MLRLEGVCASYSDSRVLFGVDLEINESEVVALLGRNGMGKTTTINSLFGLVNVDEGEIVFGGEKIRGLASYQVARRGIALVPEGRQIFPNLSVRENLVATSANHNRLTNAWTLDVIFDLFPALAVIRNRSAGLLSGGEQQMLAIGRALLTNPLLLVLDEATEGLAPKIRGEIWDVLAKLRKMRQSVLVIDKDVRALSRVADRFYVMEKGRSVLSGTAEALVNDSEIRDRYLSA